MRVSEAESRPKPNGARASKDGRADLETKRGKFERLATQRVKAIIRRIHMLAKMGGNPKAYDYGDDDVALIIARLTEEIDGLKQAMTPRGRQASIEFDFEQ